MELWWSDALLGPASWVVPVLSVLVYVDAQYFRRKGAPVNPGLHGLAFLAAGYVVISLSLGIFYTLLLLSLVYLFVRQYFLVPRIRLNNLQPPSLSPWSSALFILILISLILLSVPLPIPYFSL